MAGLNIENIDRVIAYVKTRDWHSDDWFEETDCMVGVVAAALGENRRDNRYRGSGYLEQKLGVTPAQTSSLYIMDDDDPYGPRRSKYAFCNMPTAEQNTILVTVLETLKDTGKIVWTGVPG